MFLLALLASPALAQPATPTICSGYTVLVVDLNWATSQGNVKAARERALAKPVTP